MILPAVYLGDFTAQATRMLALVSSDAQSGANVSAIRLCVGETLSPDQFNSWIFDVGLLDNSGLKLLAQRSLADGFAGGVQKILAFNDPLLVPRGGVLACRLSVNGAPPPLSGLTAVVEFGSLSSRRS